MTYQRSAVLTVITLVVLAPALGTTVVAQEGPSTTLTGATITAEAGQGTTSVEATYRIKVSGSGTLSNVKGQLWKFSGRQINQDSIKTTVNGESVQPEVKEKGRFLTISVPVDGIQAGETVTLKVSYKVSEPSDSLQTPIFVPDAPTKGQNEVVDITMQLPSGQTPQGDVFPKPTSVDGNVIKFNLLHVPGSIVVSTSGGLPLQSIAAVAGILIVLAFVGYWYRYERTGLEQPGGV